MTSISKPRPLSARALPYRRVKRTPANAENSPVATKSSSLIRLTRMPAKYAASSWEPIAKRERPGPVACSTTAVTAARTMKSSTG